MEDLIVMVVVVVEEEVVELFNVKIYQNIVGLTVLVVILVQLAVSQLLITWGMLHLRISSEGLPITVPTQRKKENDIVSIFVVVINLVS